MTTPPGKKERTRARLLAVALELFADQGYDDTSIAQIAERAGVSEMTFFRYFPSKESLLLDDPYDPLIAAAVRDQPADLAPLARAARGVRSAWHALPFPATDEVRTRTRIVAESPGLRAGMWRNSAQTEASIAVALGGDAVAARIAAAATVAALNTALLEWSLGSDTDLGAAIDAALDVLEHRG
ncbi:TetR/AcrR family transcriptional regulator [Salinibacterium soli]|uniref:TetR family transcriptional regulator n=1 Tax=Antiquaquibacter soli TaxID=3064523 RepID=A0ABT9BRJ5_9MICO|nr:TetR family transcriptional regulator [Protaetiibacter sp. WY-16]MDO7883073.1 TetR family transcriptional regulator [Protaetiibacter sp. WY-16]